MNDLKINESKLLQLLQDLIRIESVNPSLTTEGKGESEIAQYIGNYLEKIGLIVNYQKLDINRTNVIGILEGSGKGKTIMLNGHTDTVTASGMEIEPFKPRYEKGKVYGRGSYDMKGGLASQIMAVQSIIESNKKLKGNVMLSFVADEEYASLGTEKLIEEYSADAAIVCEPTNLLIMIAHKGYAWIKVGVYGKAAHGSLSGFGIDAIVKAGKFLVKLENMEKNILSQKKHPLLSSPSVHASLINGGIELSTYPDYCEIQLERRTLPGEDREYVIQEINDLIKKLKEEDGKFNADFDVFFYRSPLEIPREQPIVESLNKACNNILKRKSRFSGHSGWTDAALLNDAGIPTVLFGPKGVGAHGLTEYVYFKSVVLTAYILISTIVDFCNS